MKSKTELQTTKTNVSNEEMAYTNRELRDLVSELVDSHIEALNKLQTAEGKNVRAYSGIGHNSDPMLASL